MTLWTVTSAATTRGEIRDSLDLLAGHAIWYGDGGPDAAYTSVYAEGAFQISQGFALALSGLLLATAPEPVVISRLLDAGLEPLPATSSRYIAYAVGSGFVPGSTIWQGGGPTGGSQWRTVTDEVILTVTAGDAITIEAVDPGPLQLTGIVEFTPTTPVVGVTGLAFDAADADPYQLGRDAETLPRMRARAARGSASTGSYAGMRRALLELPWIVAADVSGGGGLVEPTIAPAPVGADQEAQLAQTLYDTHPAGITIRGDTIVEATDVNGRPVNVGYTAGSTQAVSVGVSYTLDGSIADDDVRAGITAAIESLFAGLSTGESILRLRVFGAISQVPGISAAGLLLNGTTTASVAPATVADVLIPTPITLVSA